MGSRWSLVAELSSTDLTSCLCHSFFLGNGGGGGLVSGWTGVRQVDGRQSV